MIDRVKFIINTVAPDFLPFFKTEPGYTRNEITSWELHICDGQQSTRLSCSVSFLVAGNVNMAWYLAESYTFVGICESSRTYSLSKFSGQDLVQV